VRPKKRRITQIQSFIDIQRKFRKSKSNFFKKKDSENLDELGSTLNLQIFINYIFFSKKRKKKKNMLLSCSLRRTRKMSANLKVLMKDNKK
jgi:hypothetical protein